MRNNFYLAHYKCQQSALGQGSMEMILLIVAVSVMVFSLFTIFLRGPIIGTLNDSQEKLRDYVAGTPPGTTGVDVDPIALPRGWYEYKQEGPYRLETGVPNAEMPPNVALPRSPLPPKVPLARADIPRGELPGRQDLGQGAVAGAGQGAGGALGGGGGLGSGAGGDRGLPGRPGDQALLDKLNGGKGGLRGGDQRRGFGEGGEEVGPDAGRRRKLKKEEVEWVYNDKTKKWERKDGKEEEEKKGVDKDRNEGKAAKGGSGARNLSSTREEFEFDWLTILRILALVGLLVFIFYVAIGSSRRRRNG